MMTPVALAVTMAVAGLAFGMVYFEALRRTVDLLAARRGLLEPLTLTLGRIGAALILLALAANLGAPALLAAFGGFLLARMAALRRDRRAHAGLVPLADSAPDPQSKRAIRSPA
jgi:hypothetical protein